MPRNKTKAKNTHLNIEANNSTQSTAGTNKNYSTRWALMLLTTVISGGLLAYFFRVSMPVAQPLLSNNNDLCRFSPPTNYGFWNSLIPNNKMNSMVETIQAKSVLIYESTGQEDDAEQRLQFRVGWLKLSKAIEEVRYRFPQASYIDLVLNYPGFRIWISSGRYEIAGIYHVAQNSIEFNLHEIDSPDFVPTVLHEFWHAYKSLIHCRYHHTSDKANHYYAKIALPYDARKNDAAQRRRQVQAAIDKGDDRILNLLPKLMKKKRNGTLNSKEQDCLDRMIEAAENYTPLRTNGMLNQQNWLKIAKNLRDTVDRGNFYRYQYSRQGQIFTVYVDHYEKANDGAIVSGYTTPDPLNMKIDALIGDTLNRKYNTQHNYKMFGSNPPEMDILTEHDAHIMQNGQINEVFYPELLAFHSGEHEEFLNDLPELAHEDPTENAFQVFGALR